MVWFASAQSAGCHIAQVSVSAGKSIFIIFLISDVRLMYVRLLSVVVLVVSVSTSLL